MDLLKSFIITLITIIIFISAVELVLPDNSFKKYVKFVMGLILTAVILNPILSFVEGGSSEITNSISKYINKSEIESNARASDNSKINEKSFNVNLNRNIENLLKKEFENYNFKCESKCNVDYETFDYTIEKIDIFVVNKGIKKIKKVDLTKEDGNLRNDEYKSIKKFVEKELDLKNEEVNIYEGESEGK
ncbi:stage III sporulation protein AF [Clostridium chrysemydis]|uniref:stage III sporulation protein AF n=1 Tax=Clostridium chrysemydis TaxID=2665504 RepID=UPI001883ABB0|nr:stage III sporulation protein AF [Clostridium chrysemydis]